MTLKLMILLTLIQQLQAISNCATENFCPPRTIRPKIQILGLDPAVVFLGQDEKSGCKCRYNPNANPKYIVCFGRDECTKVPYGFKMPYFGMKFVSSIVPELKPGDFDAHVHLQLIVIESHFRLARIRPGTFGQMKHLTNMSLSDNPELKSLEPHSFDGLVNLQELFIVKNKFTKIGEVTRALSRNVLPNLQKLSLNENIFNELYAEAFAPMKDSPLKILDLSLCTTGFIHPQAFDPLTSLEMLGLNHNHLNGTFCAVLEQLNGSMLHTLFLKGYKGSPKMLLEVIAKLNITSLSIGNNQFEIITKEFFPLMENIRILDLEQVLCVQIDDNAFDNLPNLKTLLLSKNHLPSIPDAILNLSNLTYLDLRANSNPALVPSSYYNLFNRSFEKMTDLMYLDLSSNRLNLLDNKTFIGLKNLKYLHLHNAGMYMLYNDSFASLKNLEVLHLPNNDFLKGKVRGFDLNVFRGLENLKILNLSGCHVSFISTFGNPFRYLKNLENLTLDSNSLNTILPEDFADLTSLKYLDLSNNLITTWNQPVFQTNFSLKTLKLNKNKLSFISQEMFKDFANILNVEINRNQFICSCAKYGFYQQYLLMKNSNKSVLNSISKDDNCTSPDNFKNITIVQYLRKMHKEISCKDLDPSSKLGLILPASVCGAFLVILLFFSYYYRWHIKYWMFLAKLHLSRKGKISASKINSSYANFQYDAFVSYSNVDRHFVINLISMLENYEPFLKLCVYERDFEIGTIISESVLESVAKSRKTVLIISENYVKSQWCRWESQIADHHRLFFGNEDGEVVNDTLVLIKLEPINENHLTPTLKYLLKTRIYLLWEEENSKKQEIFWNKLRSTLTPPRKNEISKL